MTAATAAMRDAFGTALLELGATCPDLVVLDADVATSTRTSAFGKKYPERFFNVGVAEANMTDIAAGFATCGLRPVVSTFGLFLSLKCADQIRNIIAYNNLPVVLAGNYAGFSDSYDGASHQAILDISILRAMPNMAVIVPGDAVELRQALEFALKRNGPTYLRICRNPTPVLFDDAPPFEFGRVRKLRDGSDLTIAVSGVPTFMAIEAARRLAARGVSVDLLEVSTLKPVDAQALVESASKTGRVLTVEEHTIVGGAGGAIAEAISSRCRAVIDRLGIEDCFGESGDYVLLLEKYGISSLNIERRADALLERTRP
ncbi:MAG: 1-deoxy-D-xylulose-5-phosphate synthase [Acidobacteria bacterium]|nr:1-deoxy-D-xylulose-5-phosphate synthase [Acidobacteriota bacterium]